MTRPRTGRYRRPVAADPAADAPPVAGAPLRLRGVTRTFAGRPVLDGVDLDIDAGRMVLATGPSGSGKTTLLQLACGLDRPDAGQVWVGDVEVSAPHRLVALRRHDVGFVFQLHHLLPALTARANVELPLLAAHVGPRERHARALAALDRVGLADCAGRRPGQISGGERQRVAIARAIVHGPRLLLADEPTGSLDRVTADRVIALLGELRDAGTTILVVSHDLAFAAMADRHVHVEHGHVSDVATSVSA